MRISLKAYDIAGLRGLESLEKIRNTDEGHAQTRISTGGKIDHPAREKPRIARRIVLNVRHLARKLFLFISLRLVFEIVLKWSHIGERIALQKHFIIYLGDNLHKEEFQDHFCYLFCVDAHDIEKNIYSRSKKIIKLI